MKELRAIPARTLYLLGFLGAAKALTLIGLATAIAGGVVAVATGHPVGNLLLLGLISAIARALIAWAQRVASSRALLGEKERLRSALAARALDGGAGSPASMATLATQGLDELDKYYTVYLPALVTAATVPLIVGARILFADWVSALVLVLTIPLIPVFMALIGMHTRERVALASDQLARLSEHLVELARGLPVLVGLGRAKEQTDALGQLSEKHRRTTVGTLRTAFLSSLALELIATISVAVVAVFIGVRLVGGSLPLEVGLLVLILAPECMAPFREIGVAFHASQDGREALRRARDILDSAESPTVRHDVRHDSSDAPAPSGDSVVVSRLSVRFEDRAELAVDEVCFAARRGITLIDGRSGAGKSTVLAVLAGGIPSSAISGSVGGIDPERLAWLPQHPRVASDTVAEEIALYGGSPALLKRLELAHLAAASPEAISPGELRRLAFARVLARVDNGASVVLLDEPTAQLDAHSAGLVVAELERIRDRATIIVASHDEAVRSLASRVVALGAPSQGTTALAAEPGAGTVRPVPERARGGALQELRRFLRPVRARMAGAIALGCLAALFAVGLTGLSGWLIVRAAEHPPIMYLLVAIVGVRFFGIGRAVLRYGERLVGHDAVFGALTGLRLRVWTAMASGTDRTQLAAGATLDRLVRDVDRVRDLSIRVVIPVVVGPVVMVAAIVTTALLAPSAIVLFVALTVVMLVVAPAAAVWGDRRATRGSHELRSQVLRRLAAALIAADDLRGNGVGRIVLARLAALDRRAGAAERRSASALGLGGAVVVAGGATSAVLATTLPDTNARIVAVLALVCLAIIEPLTDYVAAIQLVPALRQALHSVATPPPSNDDKTPVARPITSIELRGVSAGWQAGSDVVTDVTASVTRGDWLAITGPSGAGKSTLAAVVLGQLAPSSGEYLLDGVDATGLDLTRAIGWCPQDAHLFDSTLRGNLVIARDRAHVPTDNELFDVLDRVGLSPLVAGMPAGLETRVGREGAQLSGGERQRLAVARALLTGADVVVLDEPTAHLDEQTATALMNDLRVALADRITVLVTHHALDLGAADLRIRLGAVRTPANVGGRS